MFIFTRSIIVFALISSLSACVGTIVDAAVDTTIAVAKVPFKVAGAAIDVATGDGDDKKESDDETDGE